MRLNLCLFAVLFLLSSMAASYGSSNAGLQANVMVVCPFYLSENALPVYAIGSSITLNYTVFSQAQCTSNDLHGSFVLQYSSNNVQVQSVSISSTATQTHFVYDLPTINSLVLSPGNYKAIVSFSTFGSSNESIREFVMVRPVNVVVTDFAVSPASVDVGSPITFTANIFNDGGLASGQIGVNIVISGPQSITISESASPLSPGQSELLSFILSNVTGAGGAYSADLFATFVASNTVMQSNTRSVTYSVTQPTASQGGPRPAPGAVVAVVPMLSFTQVPFYSSLTLGSTDITSIGLKNVADIPITANLSISPEFGTVFGLSAHSIYLVPGESVLVQLVFNANNLNLPGTYVVPINISLSALNMIPVTRTQYLTYIVSRSVYNVSIYSQILLMQSNVSVTTTLVGARNISLTNASLVTMLPSSVVGNSSKIKTYGLPATITSSSSGPQINWLVPYLPAGKGVTFSYSISMPDNIGMLEYVQNLLIVPSVPPPTSILRVVSIQTPTFYANSVNRVTVGVLYTGTMPQSVKFALTTTGTAEVLNPVQIVNASPNQLLQQTFNVKTMNATGTLMLSLGIESRNASVNYTLPAIVLQSPQAAITTTIPQAITSGAQAMKYVSVVLAVAAAGVVAGWIRGIRKRPRYDAEKANELIRLRERMKRSEENP